MVDRTLITGGAGFIGLHLAGRIVERGGAVTLLDDFSRARRDDDLARLRPAVELVEWDLCRPIPDDLLTGRFDHVFHFAGAVGVRLSNQRPGHVLRVNLLTALHILEWCVGRGGMKLCFSSSSEVYAGSVDRGLAPVPTPEDVPVTLTQPQLPRAAYGASKLMGELLFEHLAAAAFPVRVVRYHNVYGPRMGYDHVIPEFLVRAFERRDPFAVHGVQTRAFCYVDDALDATLRVMALDGPALLRVNIGDDRRETTTLDLAREIAALEGYAPRFDAHPAPPGSPERRCPDLRRLRALTGFEPKVDLAEGLRRTHAWYRAAWSARG